MRMTKARGLDPQTRKYIGRLRAIVARRAEFATDMPDRERRAWLRECDQLLARPATHFLVPLS
jgi:hypothetical protein